MKRVAGGLVFCALIAGAIACTSDDPPESPPTKNVAVEPEDVVRHEATSGAPISYGIDVPEGAVQVGPLVRQRRAEVAEVIDGPSGRAESFENNKLKPETRDPEQPTPPDFTTAMLRIDGEPSEVVPRMLSELSDSLAGSDIDPEKWASYCTVDNGTFIGCRLHTRGTTDDDELIAVEFTVDPGDPKAKTAPAGSLLRPVIVLTLERLEKPDGENDREPNDPADAQARESQAAIDAQEAEQRAKAAAKKRLQKNNKNQQADNRGNGAEDDAEETADNEGGSDGGSNGSDKSKPEPTWPKMKREWPAEPGSWILTPKWKIRPNTEVILSSSAPQVALLAVKDGADSDRIARRYIRAFADEATTPKIDQVEDRNELSVTYTPRNDGSGPAVAVTTVATGRGNYIELLFSDGDPSDDRGPSPNGGSNGPDGGNKRSDGGKKSGNKPAA